MKKLLAAILAIAMLFSLSGSVFAVQELTGKSEAEFTAEHPTKATGKLYGFFLNPQHDAGFGEFDLAQNKFTLYDNTFPYYIYAGVYVKTDDGGAYYGVYLYSGSRFVLARFDDIVTGEYTDLGNAPEQIVAMAVNYANNIVYALGRSGSVYTVDVNQGVFKMYSALSGMDGNPIMMTVDNEGEMYVVTSNSVLHSVDIPTGKCSYIATMDIDPILLQSMTYDYNNDTIYWCFYLVSGQTGVCTIDRKTGATKILGTLDGYEGLGVFSIPEKITLPDPVDITGLTLEPTSLKLIGGQKSQLYATVQPEDKYISDRSIVWTTSDKNVAEISQSGIVTARHAGSATVTAATADGKYSKTCTVNVESAEVRFRELSDALNYVQYGEDGWMAYHTDEKAYPFKAETVQGIGTVAKSGNKGAQGTTSWVETVYPVHMTGSSSVTFDYRVNCANADKLALYVNDVLVWSDTGEKNWESYTYTVQKTGDYSFRWAYEKANLGSYGDDTAMLKNIEYNVLPAEPLRGVTLTPENANMLVNAVLHLEVGYVPANIENTNVKFTSNNTAVATVNAEGVVTAQSEGSAVITVTTEEGGYKAQTTVNVVSPVDVRGLKFIPLEINSKTEFTLGMSQAQYIEHDGKVKYAVGFKVSMADGDAAMFKLRPGENPAYDTMLMLYDENFNLLDMNDDGTGVETGYSSIKFIPEKGGTYYLVATTASGYLADGGDVILEADSYEPVHVESIHVPSMLSLGLDKYLRLNVTVMPTENDFPGITFKSSDTSVVDIDENGVMYGVSEGTAVVTATSVDGGISGTCTVYVEKFNAPDPDGYIYLFNMHDFSGTLPDAFVRYDSSTNAVDKVAEIDGISDFYSGVYKNGMLYGYSLQMSANEYHFLFAKIDTDDFTVQDTMRMEGKMVPIDMTYDHTTDTVYAAVINADTAGDNSLAIVDTKTGRVDIVARFNVPAGSRLMNIESDTDGNLYGVTMEGTLYRIDKKTAALQKVADLGIKNSYITTMSYEHNEKKMYWFPATSIGSGNASYAVVFDPVTGKVESSERTKGYEFTFGFNYSNPDAIMHTVEFLGLKHETVAKVLVVDGGSAKAPDMTHPDGVAFGMWDKDFDDVREDIQVQGYYMGDVNMNAETDSGDATLILRKVVGSGELNGDQAYLSDVNKNEITDSADATIVLRYIVGTGWMGK